MNSRERVTRTLNHQAPDKTPIDFGATPVSGISASLIYRIKKHFGLLKPGERIRVSEPYQVLGEIDDQLRDFLGLDVIGIPAPRNMFGFANENWKEWELFDGTPVWVPGKFNTQPDQDGNIPMWAEDDRNFPPSSIMPKGGFYFDSLDRQKPYDDDALDPRENTEEFGLLSQADLDYYRQKVEKAFTQTDKAIAIALPGMAFGDIALVPAPFLKDPRGIRSVEEWYMALAAYPDYIKKVFEFQAEIAVENLKSLYSVVGDKVQIAFISGTDFGTQHAPIISTPTYRELFFPYQKKLNDWIHAHTPWKTFIHSCGAVEPLLSSFIEAGFDILNPVQCSAAGMAPEGLKAKYGDKLVFWGGGVNTQRTLPRGTPDEVRAEVAERLRIFGKGGGYVFNSIHNLQADVPVENFEAMLQAYRAHTNG